MKKVITNVIYVALEEGGEISHRIVINAELNGERVSTMYTYKDINIAMLRLAWLANGINNNSETRAKLI